MAEISGSYKEKYLTVLDEQERQEKQFAYQLEQMRKTLNHLAAAAQGLDKNLDASLLALREKIRGATGPQVIEQMERVQQAVTEFERQRERENSVAAEKMRLLLAEFLALKLPADLRDKLRAFSKSLQPALHSYRSYPRVLNELTLLLQSALQAAMNPPQTFFQRLRPGRTLEPARSSQDGPPSPEAPFSAESLQLAPDPNLKAEHNVAPSLSGLSNATASLKGASLLDEDSYEKVAGRIALTLRELVDNIEPNDVVRHRVDMVRLRIERGMDWYALSVTLEDIRDILMQRYLDVDREFSRYLQGVNQELKAIGEVLGVALDREESDRVAADTLSEAVTSEVEKLHSSLAASAGIDSLKQAVSHHLEVIQGALTEFRTSQSRENQLALGEELRRLLAKVESIEHESSKTKELLEEERYRATHDSLTGLPNREAYNERAFHELQRYQRYGHPLTLAVCDIDHFKSINDSYGHQAGDKVIKLIARVIATRLRKVDLVARYGGEEFVILLPETGPLQARKVLDKVRAAVASAAFRFRDNPVTISISFGITGFVSDDSVESAFARADKALYQAKAEGRNRCVVSDEAPDEA